MVHEIPATPIGICGRHRYFPMVTLVGANNRIEEFLHLGVAQLGLAEYFTDEVDGLLYLVDVARLVSFDDQGGANHMGGCRDVEE